MTLEEFKDVMQLNKLAKSWIEDYKKNNLGVHSENLKKQYKEMNQLKSRTDNLIEKQSGEAGADGDWKSLLAEIKKLAQSNPVFAACFGKSGNLLKEGASVSKEAGMLAIKLKNLTSAWVGNYGDDVKDDEANSLVATIYEQAKKVIASPKDSDSDMVILEFYGSKNKRCNKMLKTVEFIADEHKGLVDIVINKVEDEDKSIHKKGIENLPAIIFKRGKKSIAKHEGSLSISALQSKVNMLLEGANITDSSSINSINDLKKINKKELYSMGEYLMFYFTLHNDGLCKKTTPVVEKAGRGFSKVKFESVMVDGSHSLHRSFGVTHVPSIVFVRLGKVIGKHVGYINPSNLDELMDKFTKSAKTKMGLTQYGDSRIIPGEEDKVKEKDKKKKK